MFLLYQKQEEKVSDIKICKESPLYQYEGGEFTSDKLSLHDYYFGI